jgi:hypothetical protein
MESSSQPVVSAIFQEESTSCRLYLGKRSVLRCSSESGGGQKRFTEPGPISGIGYAKLSNAY